MALSASKLSSNVTSAYDGPGIEVLGGGVWERYKAVVKDEGDELGEYAKITMQGTLTFVRIHCLVLLLYG